MRLTNDMKGEKLLQKDYNALVSNSTTAMTLIPTFAKSCIIYTHIILHSVWYNSNYCKFWGKKEHIYYGIFTQGLLHI